MNLQKLFETQKALDEAIVKKKGLEGQDLLPQKILALQVELGECANEWRGFKFWSENQKPKPPKHNWEYTACGQDREWLPEWGYESYPLLEEYVDCLHFMISIGLEIGIDEPDSHDYNSGSVVDQFNELFREISEMSLGPSEGMDDPQIKEFMRDRFEMAFSGFIGLAEMLGFTWDQVERAYYDKNKINHQRQANGY